MNKAILFNNWTEEDFVGMWDSVEYQIKARQQMMFPDYLARHFAKHATDKELQKLGRQVNDPTRERIETKFLTGEVEARNDLEAEIKVMNEEVRPVEKVEEVKDEIKEEAKKEVKEVKVEKKKRFCEFCDSKGGRHLKTCKLYKKVKKVEDSFEG